jgi:hypothetical protein
VWALTIDPESWNRPRAHLRLVNGGYNGLLRACHAGTSKQPSQARVDGLHWRVVEVQVEQRHVLKTCHPLPQP